MKVTPGWEAGKKKRGGYRTLAAMHQGLLRNLCAAVIFRRLPMTAATGR